MFKRMTIDGCSASQERELDDWAHMFYALHARMQTYDARQAVDALFSATDAELNLVARSHRN